jgi:hypothetical protein
MIKLTPEEWIAETKKFLVHQNMVILEKKKPILREDYKYIGMAVLVSEFVKNNLENDHRNRNTDTTSAQ